MKKLTKAQWRAGITAKDKDAVRFLVGAGVAAVIGIGLGLVIVFFR